MVIEADEGGSGITLRHDNGGCPEPTAGIRDFRTALELCLDAIEGWNPISRRDQARFSHRFIETKPCRQEAPC